MLYDIRALCECSLDVPDLCFLRICRRKFAQYRLINHYSSNREGLARDLSSSQQLTLSGVADQGGHPSFSASHSADVLSLG